MHSVLRMEKKFSAKALSYGLLRLDIEGVMPYDCVSLKYACDVYWGLSKILCIRYFQVKNRTKFYGAEAALSAVALSIT